MREGDHLSLAHLPSGWTSGRKSTPIRLGLGSKHVATFPKSYFQSTLSTKEEPTAEVTSDQSGLFSFLWPVLWLVRQTGDKVESVTVQRPQKVKEERSDYAGLLVCPATPSKSLRVESCSPSPGSGALSRNYDTISCPCLLAHPVTIRLGFM